eukprot:6327844-Prymnesium_polylepis.1
MGRAATSRDRGWDVKGRAGTWTCADVFDRARRAHMVKGWAGTRVGVGVGVFDRAARLHGEGVFVFGGALVVEIADAEGLDLVLPEPTRAARLRPLDEHLTRGRDVLL